MSEPTVSAGDGPLIKTDVQFARAQASTNLPPAIVIRDVNLYYGAKQALFDISMDIGAKGSRRHSSGLRGAASPRCSGVSTG